MEIFILGSLLVASTIVQILFVRHFLVDVNKKLLYLIQKVNRIETLTRTVGNTLNMPIAKSKIPQTQQQPVYTGDTANKIAEDEEDSIEFSEYNPLTLPNDIKFEIEGGDTAIPPGYSDRAN